ncbi:MAG: hypothetical protein MZV63_25210 [Marinilabiliales bacterium]|nr:hypothetical protein [Marinilabiliales bacterium]
MLGPGVVTPDVARLSYGTTATVADDPQVNIIEVVPFFPALSQRRT